jgi:hypothetical protein
MHWLFSSEAIKCHLVGLGGIILFAILLINGDGVTPPEHFRNALVAWCVGYPAVLGLLWWSHRRKLRAALRELQAPTSPEQILQQRQHWRAVSLLILAGVGAGLCYMGFLGWEVKGLPAYVIGGILMAIAVMGALGINIWYGGPLDRRSDPPHEPPSY